MVLTELEKVAPSILHMWFPGTEGGRAYANLLLGNARPVGQLIAFEKVSFEANERKTIKFTITEPMLRFWNNEFVSESGEFKISTGYADHLILTKSFQLCE